MANWLCITNSNNWKIIKKNNFWGVHSRHKNTVARVKTGDKLLIYLNQERDKDNIIEHRIPAIYEAESGAYNNSSKLFKTPMGMGSESFLFETYGDGVFFTEKELKYHVKTQEKLLVEFLKGCVQF